MTIDEARASIGRSVTYRPREHRPWAGPPEEGVITSVNDSFAFVRYGSDKTSRATLPELLSLSASET